MLWIRHCSEIENLAPIFGPSTIIREKNSGINFFPSWNKNSLRQVAYIHWPASLLLYLFFRYRRTVNLFCGRARNVHILTSRCIFATLMRNNRFVEVDDDVWSPLPSAGKRIRGAIPFAFPYLIRLPMVRWPGIFCCPFHVSSSFLVFCASQTVEIRR